MSRSSAGGAAVAGGIRHEARCLAWAAAYMLAEEPLPSWAMGRRVTAVGAQTERAVDDIAILTDADGWVPVQAKKGMRLDRAERSAIADALGQFIDLDAEGVPAGRADPNRLRALDPERDRVLILTDESAP